MTAPVHYPGGVAVYNGSRGHRVVWREDGRRRQAQRASFDDACAFAVEKSRQLAHVSEAAEPGADVASVAAEWLQVGATLDGWSASYAAKQKANLDLWVLPHLAGPVDRVTRADLARVAGIVRDGIASDGYVAQVLGSLSRLWRYAATTGYLPPERRDWANMAVRGRRVQGHSREYVDPSERPDTAAVLRMIDACDDPGLAGAVAVGAFSGLRWGEMAALEGSDVDWDAGVIRVGSQVDGAGGVKLPKGNKVRETVLPAPALPWLRAAAEAGDGPLLFPAPGGGYWTPPTFGRRFDRLREAADWPRRDDGKWRWTFHSLRHHFATWLLGKSVPVEDVGALMGHASPDVTWRTYVGVREGMMGRAHEATRSL